MSVLQEILKEIDFPIPADLDSLDSREVVKHIAGHYVKRSEATQDQEILKQVSGKLFGTQYGRLAELSQGRFKKGEIKDMEFSKALETVLTAFSSEIEELKQYNGEPGKEVEELRAEVGSMKLGIAKEKLLAKIPLANSANIYQKKGFFAEIEEKYSFDLVEDEIQMMDQDGSPVDPIDTLTELARQGGVLKQNNGSGYRRTWKPEDAASDFTAKKKKEGVQIGE